MHGTDLPRRARPAMLSLIGALDLPGTRLSDPTALLAFFSTFTPAAAVDVPKKRIGSASDGGYVMLDDFAEPHIALSLGVGYETSWDRHMADLCATVHQYDHTVQEPVGQPANIRFFQKKIVDIADGFGATLMDALSALEAEGGSLPAILKIDIEGTEWPVLDTVPDAVLERFDQIVCEYHELERVADASWFERASRVMSRLNRLFQVVHVHGNNHRPLMLVERTVFPWVLEVTHASRKRFRFEPTEEQFPTELDSPNHPNRPDFWLGSFYFDNRDTWAVSDAEDPRLSAAAADGVAFVSHALNGEDIVLHRILKEIERGHYIDIGAHDPADGSVTKIFYDRGWSGINVHASKSRFDRLVAERPRDRNLLMVVSARAGMSRAPHPVEMTIDVPAVSLKDLCRDLPFDVVHFLRIEAGGAEHEVLLGTDFTNFRPWLVIVAAIHPATGERTEARWRGILEDAGYELTLFDGVNIWFLAREQDHLRHRLDAPANTRDGYVPIHVQRLERTEAALTERLARLEASTKGLRSTSAALAEERAEVEASLHVYRSHVGMLERLRDSHDAEVSRLIADQSAETTRLVAEHGAEVSRLIADQSAETTRLVAEHGAEKTRLIAEHGAETSELKQDLSEARVELQDVKERLGRELGNIRQQARIEEMRHLEEINGLRGQLARLAFLEVRSERLRQVSDLTSGGVHLQDRGAALLRLREVLLHQAATWQEEVEGLQGRLAEAAARSDALYASTSWRMTSPLRSLRQAGHVLRHELQRLPGVMRQRASGAGGRSTPGFHGNIGDPVEVTPVTSMVETETHALMDIVGHLDSEMSLIAELFEVISDAVGAEGSSASGPSYVQARIDEQLTHWVLAELVRLRRAAA